jgi:hypothetical protein
MRWFLLSLALVFWAAQSQQPNLKAENANTNSTKDQRGTSKSPFVVEVIPSGDAKKESAENAAERKEKLQLDRNLTEFTSQLRTFTALLVVVGLLQLIIFGLQAKRLRQTVETMDRTAETQLRAYLSIDNFPYFSHVDTTDNKVWWSIHPVWKNGGTTPTRSLFLNTHANLTDQPLPENFDFPSAPGETIRMLVGANSAITARTLGIRGEDLVAVQNGTKFFYILGMG